MAFPIKACTPQGETPPSLVTPSKWPSVTLGGSYISPARRLKLPLPRLHNRRIPHDTPSITDAGSADALRAPVARVSTGGRPVPRAAAGAPEAARGRGIGSPRSQNPGSREWRAGSTPASGTDPRCPKLPCRSERPESVDPASVVTHGMLYPVRLPSTGAPLGIHAPPSPHVSESAGRDPIGRTVTDRDRFPRPGGRGNPCAGRPRPLPTPTMTKPGRATVHRPVHALQHAGHHRRVVCSGPAPITGRSRTPGARRRIGTADDPGGLSAVEPMRVSPAWARAVADDSRLFTQPARAFRFLEVR